VADDFLNLQNPVGMGPCVRRDDELIPDALRAHPHIALDDFAGLPCGNKICGRRLLGFACKCINSFRRTRATYSGPGMSIEETPWP